MTDAMLASLGYPADILADRTCTRLDTDLVLVGLGWDDMTEDSLYHAIARVDPATGAVLAVRALRDARHPELLARTGDALYVASGQHLLTLDARTLAGDCPIAIGPIGTGTGAWIFSALGEAGTLYVGSGGWDGARVIVQVHVPTVLAECAAAPKE